MKFYKAGKKVRNIDELNSDELFSVCGVAGKFRKIKEKSGITYIIKSQDERITLAMGREELLDRIYFGMVYHIKKEFKPRAETIAKMF